MAEFTPDGVYARRLPVPEHRDENSERYTVEIGDSDALVAKRTERLRKQLGPGYDVRATVETIRQNPIMHMNFSLDVSLWPRFAAKLALAFGREVLGEPWLGTAQARHLRAVMWNLPSVAPLVALRPLPEVVEAGDPLRPLLAAPPAHVVTVQRSTRGAMLMLHLFGTFRFGVPLGEEGPPPRYEPVWIFDPVAGSARRTTWPDFIMEAIASGSYDSHPMIAGRN